jgi:transglutaminase-like putative cysteine protease
MTANTMRRPRLSFDELQQLRWLLGGMLTLLALWTVFYMDIEAWTLMALTTVATLAVLVRPSLPAVVPGWVHTLAFPAIVAFFAADLWIFTEVLPAMVRLDILLLLYRSISYRQRRDDLQIIVLGLFLIVVAGVLTVSLTFAAQILIYTAAALGLLLVITLSEAAQRTTPPATEPFDRTMAPAWATHIHWPHLFRRLHEVADWRIVTMSVVLFLGVVGITAVLFLAIPRFQLENSMFLDRFISKRAKSGFSDTIRIGEVTDIQQDTSVALSVSVSDLTQVPSTPYWRMLVLDQYSNGTFKFSAGLRRDVSGARTGSAVYGQVGKPASPPVYWTFYLESGISRYLPLVGRFAELRFRESQNHFFSNNLGILLLRDEPVTMTAYRVEGFEVSERLPDYVFAERWRQRDDPSSTFLARQIVTVRRDTDLGTLSRLVTEITGGVKPGAAEFARLTNLWLNEHHAYSLSPRIPAGDGDPLVRWMASDAAGHCELFAGSFVLLARAAGYPARVVTGFRGGSWNAYSENFTVRNSDAHAWAEIFDEVSGEWLRADPLGRSASAQTEVRGQAGLAARTDRSWTARLDSLRVFWYRRIVSFDQRSQTDTLRALKSATENSGREARAAITAFFGRIRDWFLSPWDVRRFATLLGIIAGLAGLHWLWREFGRRWWRQVAAGRGGRRFDPTREEASRWLARMTEADPEARGEQEQRVVADLQRIRFGARATWPAPERVFRSARSAWRAARRGRRRATPAAK